MTGTLALAGAQVTTVLARDADGPEFGKASPLGLLLVLLLLVGTVFLIRSMNKRLRKLPTEFPGDDPAADQAADSATDVGATDFGGTDTAKTDPGPTDPGSTGTGTGPARGRNT